MNVTTQNSQARQLLRLSEVIRRIGCGRSWIYREAAAGRFPAPIKLGRMSCWDSRAIDDFIEAQIERAAGGAR